MNPSKNGRKQGGFPIEVNEVGMLYIDNGPAVPAFVESVHLKGVRFVHEEVENNGPVTFVRDLLAWGKFRFKTAFPEGSGPSGYDGFLLQMIDLPQEQWTEIDLRSRQAYALERYLENHPPDPNGMLADFFKLLRARSGVSDKERVACATRLSENVPVGRLIALIVPPTSPRPSSRSRWNRCLISIACDVFEKDGDCKTYYGHHDTFLRSIQNSRCFDSLRAWMDDPSSWRIVDLQRKIGQDVQTVRHFGEHVLNLKP